MTSKKENKNIETIAKDKSQGIWNYVKHNFIRPIVFASSLFALGYLAYHQPKQNSTQNQPVTTPALEVLCQGDSSIYNIDNDYDGDSDRRIVVYRDSTGGVAKCNTYEMTGQGWHLVKKYHPEYNKEYLTLVKDSVQLE